MPKNNKEPVMPAHEKSQESNPEKPLASPPKTEESKLAGEAKKFNPQASPQDLLSIALAAIMFLLGAIYYPQLPDKIIAYTDTSDSGAVPKLFGLFAVPLAGAVLYIIMTYIPPILIAKGRKIPQNTVSLLKPAALAYFAYTEVSIVAFNAAKMPFSSMQDAAIVLGIGIAYAAASIAPSKENLFGKILKNAGEESIALFNIQLGRALALWSAIVFLGFFAESYLLLLVFVPAALVLLFAIYNAYKLGKKSEISAVKKEVEGSKSPQSPKVAP